MRAALLLAALALLPFPAVAAERVSPSEFEEYAEGWTLYFERDGERWGEEQFSEGGGTLWRYKDGTCSEGAWRPYEGDICFYYFGMEDSILCWQVMRDEEGMFARLETPEEEIELRITGRDRRQLICGEPAVDL